MTSEEFLKFYKDENDFLAVPIKDDIGFNVIRNYPKEYGGLQGKKIFINVSLAKSGFLFGRIDAVEQSKHNSDSYTIITEKKKIKKITSFSFFEDEKIFFNEKNGTVVTIEKKVLTLNQFVDILVKNHLSDKLFWKRKVNFVVDCFLKFLFWLSDKRYKKIEIMLDIYHQYKNSNYKIDNKKNEDPFFKYFSFGRNFLFAFLIFLFILSIFISKIKIFKDFSVSNPTIVFSFFILLFLAERISSLLDKNIEDFLNKKKNFISKMHNYLFSFKFKLKFPK